MESCAIVPVPATLADNMAAAFTPLAGQPPLVRVVRAAAAKGVVVIVAAAEQLVADCRKCVAPHDLSSVTVIPAPGAGRRAHCVAAGIEHTSTRFALVYDVFRPLTSSALQTRVAAALRAGSSVVMPALPLTDSVKAVDANGFVTATLDRSTLKAVQYPRGFTVEQLSALLARRTSDDFDELDEALAADLPITLVEGDPDAFVVELPEDKDYVEAIIASRQ